VAKQDLVTDVGRTGIAGVWRALIRPVLSWRHLSPNRKAAAREALVDLVRAHALVRMRRFSAYAPQLGTASTGDPDWEWSENLESLADVRWAVRRWNRFFGGRFTCLMEAMAGQAMLARRGVSSAVVLGVKPGVGSDDPMAHAWLRVGQSVVLGDEERPGHIPVASYLKVTVGPQPPSGDRA